MADERPGEPWWGAVDDKVLTPLSYLDRLRAGVDFDVVGLQMSSSNTA
jgi:hypothetical protein